MMDPHPVLGIALVQMLLLAHRSLSPPASSPLCILSDSSTIIVWLQRTTALSQLATGRTALLSFRRLKIGSPYILLLSQCVKDSG